MTTLALSVFIFPDTVMLSACVVLTLAAVIFVFWIEPDPGRFRAAPLATRSASRAPGLDLRQFARPEI